MTKRLYYDDCYLTEFRARVIDAAEDGRRVYLDQTAFYPTSGGQPFDTGILGGARVLDVVDEEDRIAHVLDGPLSMDQVDGKVDAARRFDHMQQHTGQHLLSAVLEELFGTPTLSFHMGDDLSTLEIGAASHSLRQIESTEERCAEIVREARPIVITFEDASGDLGLRKQSQRTGTLRIVSISNFDRSACGGTHVRNSAEIGPVIVRKIEKIRGNVRLEFVCGRRALRQARQDFLALQDISRHLSAAIEKTPALVAAQVDRLRALEKTSQRLTIELAQREGRELWAVTTPDPDGIRRSIHTGGIDDAVRTRAQAFVAQGKAIFVASCEDPPSLLLAASPDSGIHAGERVKAAVTGLGGRGGGNAALAQGSVPSGCDMQAVTDSIAR